MPGICLHVGVIWSVWTMVHVLCVRYVYAIVEVSWLSYINAYEIQLCISYIEFRWQLRYKPQWIFEGSKYHCGWNVSWDYHLTVKVDIKPQLLIGAYTVNWENFVYNNIYVLNVCLINFCGCPTKYFNIKILSSWDYHACIAD